MRQLIFILLFSAGLYAQSGIYNKGNLQLHDKGSLGFHTALINDGMFNQNRGLVGFYKDEKLAISGSSRPLFYDFELAVENNLYLRTPIAIGNSLNFIYGDIKIKRNDKNVYVQLMPKAFYEGEGPQTKVDGHVAIDEIKEFSFPVGYNDKLRPLRIRFVDGNFFARCEYYYENPNNPVSLYDNFDTAKKATTLGNISPLEFWNLTTSGLIQITLSWDADSNLSSILRDIANATVAGWSKKEQQWHNLGNAEFEGDLATGWLTSNPFNANNYEIFSLGSLVTSEENIPGNYALSPNGDGINDYLVFKIIEKSPNNSLKIFDRTGRAVYEKTDYANEFKGVANKGSTASHYGVLTAGVYFYLLELHDLGTTHQGYFYIAQ